MLFVFNYFCKDYSQLALKQCFWTVFASEHRYHIQCKVLPDLSKSHILGHILTSASKDTEFTTITRLGSILQTRDQTCDAFLGCDSPALITKISNMHVIMKLSASQCVSSQPVIELYSRDTILRSDGVNIHLQGNYFFIVLIAGSKSHYNAWACSRFTVKYAHLNLLLRLWHRKCAALGPN